jgi:hypothetical protein
VHILSNRLARLGCGPRPYTSIFNLFMGLALMTCAFSGNGMCATILVVLYVPAFLLLRRLQQIDHR